MKKYGRIYKKISIFAISAFMVLTSSYGLTNGDLFAYNDKSDVLDYDVNLSKDGKSAVIDFKINEVDENYTIQSVKQLQDDAMIYDAENPNDASYTVTENGTYQFQINYLDNSKENESVSQTSEESNIVKDDEDENIGLQQTEETQAADQTNEESNMLSDEQPTEVKEEIIDITIDNIKHDVIQDETVKDKTTVQDKTEENTAPSNVKYQPSTLAADTGNNSIKLDEVFNINESLDHKGYKIAKVNGSSIQLTSENLKGSIQYQTVGLTSKTKISFKRSWKLSATYSQALAPDGVSISFHKQANFNGSENKGGALGVYKQLGGNPSDGPGLKQGLVLELDPYANQGDADGAFKYFLDSDYSSGDGMKSSHLDIMNVTNINTLLPTRSTKRLGTRYEFDGSNVFNGVEGDLDITWDRPTMTIKISYKGHERSYQFSSDDELLNVIGKEDGSGNFDKSLDCYYTIVGSTHYISGSSGNTYFNYKEFKYTDLKPEIISTKAYMRNSQTNGLILMKDYDGTGAISDSQSAKSGDTVVVIHELKNSINYSLDISDKVMVNAELPASPTGKSFKFVGARWYTKGNPSADEQLDASIFQTGVEVKYPANSETFMIECEYKIDDYRDSVTKDILKANITAGELGMEQIADSTGVNIISRNQIRNNGQVLQEKFLTIDQDNPVFTDQDLIDKFYKNFSLNYRRQGAPTSYTEKKVTDIVQDANGEDPTNTLLSYRNGYKEYGSNQIVAAPDYTLFTHRGKLVNGTKTDDIDLRTARRDELGMYYTVVQNYNPTFDKGHQADYAGYIKSARPNGVTTAVQRVWICDHYSKLPYTPKTNLYAIGSNFTIDELTLSKMTESELKNKFAKYIQVYNDNLYIDNDHNIEGNIVPEKFDFTIQNIFGFSSSSKASATPYPTMVTISTDKGEFVLGLDVTVIESEPQFYVTIPKNIQLEDDKGIDEKHIGKQDEVALISGQESTTKNVLVKADSSFDLTNSNTSDKYTVNLYGTNSNLLPIADNKAEIGTLSASKNSIPFWLNAEKGIKDIGQYKGVMKYYISFK